MFSSEQLIELLRDASAGRSLTVDSTRALLEAPDEVTEELFIAADDVRKQRVGNAVYLRGIIEFSNHCERNCLYCGLRTANGSLERYRMSDGEIVEAALAIGKAGISTVVLQSGEDSYYDAPRICRLVERIKSETGLVITLSLGERSEEDFRAFRDAGADRYLLKHETASPDLYHRLRPGCDIESRVSCLRTLKQLNFEAGTGNMVGLPGQDSGTLAADLHLMKELDADMLGIGPFIPHPQTPLAGSPVGSVDLTLRVIALARIITGTTNIPATTALASLDPQGRVKALRAGANVVMPDFTPSQYKSRYDIYPGRADVGGVDQVLKSVRIDCEAAGRTIGTGPGNRPAYK